MRADTLYTSYEDLLIDINIYGKILSTSSASEKEMRASLLEYCKKNHTAPSLEERRYKLSNQVSAYEGYVGKEVCGVGYAPSVDIFNNSIYAFSVLEELFVFSGTEYIFSISKELKPFKETRYSFVISAELGVVSGVSNSVYAFSVSKELGITAPTSSSESYRFSIKSELANRGMVYEFSIAKELDISSTHKFSISKEIPVESSIYTFSISREIPVKSNVYTFSISKEMPVESSIYTFSISRELVANKSTYVFSISEEVVSDTTLYTFSIADEMPVESSIYSSSIKEETGVFVTEVKEEGSPVTGRVVEDFNLDFLEDDNSFFDTVPEPSTEEVDCTENVISRVESSRDTYSVLEDNSNTDIGGQFSSSTTPPSVEDVPKDLVEFLRKYPKSEVSFVLRYFTNAEITKAIRLSRVFKKKNKLFI